MDNSLSLFFSVLFICLAIYITKTEVWELQEQQEQLQNEIIELREVINNV